MNNRCGLVSISFREKSCNEIIDLAKKAGLGFIEWGSDVHCPVNDIENAKLIGEKSREAGINTYCYGSYFRVGITPVSEFESYCLTAKALGAKCIRVWAYNKQSFLCDDIEEERVIKEAQQVFAIAKRYDLFVNFEYHRGCLTERIDGALKLFSKLDNEVLRIHWQPNPEITVEENLKELDALPRVDIVHVFAWTFENGENVRHPLYNHHLTWREYISHATGKNKDCIFELEFFRDNSVNQMLDDAQTLLEII